MRFTACKENVTYYTAQTAFYRVGMKSHGALFSILLSSVSLGLLVCVYTVVKLFFEIEKTRNCNIK